MRMKLSILIVLVCGVAAGIGLQGNDRVAVADTDLDNIYGGILPRDCVYVRFYEDQCAPEESTGDCYMVGGYCTDVTWKTSCIQAPKYCRERDIYSGDCAYLAVACSGTYQRYECTPETLEECAWEQMATYACSAHPSGSTKDWCQEI